MDSITPEQLQEAISCLPTAQETADGCNCEHALAIYLLLLEAGVTATLKVCLRTENDITGEQPPVTIYSHAVVQAFETTWDEQGTEASDRWEAYWRARQDMDCRFSWKAIRGADIVQAFEAYRSSYQQEELHLDKVTELLNLMRIITSSQLEGEFA